MTMAEVVPPPPQTPCPDHNYDELKPVVLATWKHGFQGGCPECSAILTESQVVQESLNIPGTGLYLVYHSSRYINTFVVLLIVLSQKKHHIMPVSNYLSYRSHLHSILNL